MIAFLAFYLIGGGFTVFLTWRRLGPPDTPPYGVPDVLFVMLLWPALIAVVWSDRD